MNKELLTKATTHNAAALATLRRTTPASLTVFVGTPDNIDVDETLKAFEYCKLHGSAPDEWNDEPTLTFAQAFPAKVQRNPLTLKPVTPGLWQKLWKQEPEMVAAIYWGVRSGNIRDGELELKGRVRRHLETPDSFLKDVLRTMKRDERQTKASTSAVSAPADQIAQPLPSARQQGQVAAQNTLEAAYQRGEIDIGHYLKLKATPQASKWSHEKYIALGQVIREHFSLSDVQMLIFDMGLDRDDFSNTRNAAARELVQWAKRRSQLDKLSDLVKAVNPSRWMEFATEWV